MSACPGCGVECSSSDRFCGSCGRALAADSVTRTDATGAKNALFAALLIYVGTFAALYPAGLLLESPESDVDDLVHQLVTSVAFTVVGLLGVLRLGAGSLRESFAGHSTGKQLALGAALGVGIFAFNVGLLSILRWMTEGTHVGISFGVPPNFVVALLATALFPALFEEWLCRGVLWTALRRLTDARATILLTAALFALLHGLNGAGFLEVPTRFALGLVAGWLRHRTKSLAPCVLCHFVNNALAVLSL